MKLGRVVGTVVSTVDSVGAGMGEVILYASFDIEGRSTPLA